MSDCGNVAVTGGGGDPHLFGEALPYRFDPIATLKSVRTTAFATADLLLVETESAVLVAHVEQLSEEAFFVTSLELASEEGSMVVTVSANGLVFVDGLGQVTNCSSNADIFGSSLNARYVCNDGTFG